MIPKISTSFYSQAEVEKLGFKKVGQNVLLSKNVTIYGIENISLGSNVRIDDFCILTGNITIGNYCHISGFCALYGKLGIVLNDFIALSARTTLLSASDDFSGEYMTNPMIDDIFTNVEGGKIEIGKHAIIGAGCIIFPKVIVGEGVAVGAMSLINKSLPSWGIYVGQPAKFIKSRSKKLLDMEKQMIEQTRSIK